MASLAGRSPGFKNVIPNIENDAYEKVCMEVGLQHTLLPDRTISRDLFHMLKGQTMMELSTMIRGDVRFFSYLVGTKDAAKVSEISYPKRTKPTCVYRDADFIVPNDDTKLKKGDEVVLITERDHVAELRERWGEHAEEASG